MGSRKEILEATVAGRGAKGVVVDFYTFFLGVKFSIIFRKRVGVEAIRINQG